jgi:acyl CoA:acetate/3-ketoacid CoA transferase alpha subunit
LRRLSASPAKTRQIKKMISSYVGENKLFAVAKMECALEIGRSAASD